MADDYEFEHEGSQRGFAGFAVLLVLVC